MGAMFMSENVSSTLRTRHMDACLWWLTDLQETGLVKASFAPTKDNVADFGTKNVTGDMMGQLRPMLMTNKPEMHQTGNQDQTMNCGIFMVSNQVGCWNTEFSTLHNGPQGLSHVCDCMNVIVRMS